MAEYFDAGGHSRPKSGKGSFNPSVTTCDARHRLVAIGLADRPTVAGLRAARSIYGSTVLAGIGASAGGRIEDDVVAVEPAHRNPSSSESF